MCVLILITLKNGTIDKAKFRLRTFKERLRCDAKYFLLSLAAKVSFQISCFVENQAALAEAEVAQNKQNGSTTNDGVTNKYFVCLSLALSLSPSPLSLVQPLTHTFALKTLNSSLVSLSLSLYLALELTLLECTYSVERDVH